jgi:hypothetical protein
MSNSDILRCTSDALYCAQERQKYWDEQSKFYSEDELEEESTAVAPAAAEIAVVFRVDL